MILYSYEAHRPGGVVSGTEYANSPSEVEERVAKRHPGAFVKVTDYNGNPV